MSEQSPSPGLPVALEEAQSRLAEDGREALAGLLPDVYEQLRALAVSFFANQPRDQTLQPTALVHEVYLKLADGGQWTDREHFLALAATVMRQVLTDHARGRSRKKRGADWQRVTIGVAATPDDGDALEEFDLVALDRALSRLSEFDARQGRIVELRFLAGMKVGEIAAILGVSRRTVELDWRCARAWLRRELDGDGQT